MTYRTLFSHIFMSILFCCYSSTIVSAQKMMNTQQMQDFEKELEEANKAIEEYVSSLSPAEQAEFNRQVEEMSRVLENMNEDEFEKFLGEMFADEPITEPNPFIDVQPITEPVVETTALSNEDKKKVETALKVLDDIIKQSNLFMVLVNSSPELPNRITRWGTRGVINNWQTGSKWDGFKLELESLIQKLYKVEEQDLDKKYKYLLELIADESLYNNLIQLQTSLNKLVPTINLPEFGIQKLSDQSKNAIKEILNKYSESFYLLGIPKALDTLFEKYAPEAEKLRSAEEAGTKRAQEAARGVRTPSSAETAGVGQENFGYDYGYGYPQYYGGDYGYNPYDSYNPYGGYSDYGYGSEGGSGAGAGNKGGAGGNGGGGSSGAGGGKGGQEDKDKDKGKSTGSTKAVPNLEIENAISTIKTDLADIKNALVDEEGKPTKLEKLTKTVESKEDNDLDIFAGTTLATTVDKKLDAIAKSLKTIDQKRLSSAELSHYQREVQKAFDKNKKDLEMLDNALKVFGTADDIKKAKDAATKAKLPETEKENVTPNTDISKLSGTKQWAFFGGDVTKVPVPEEGKEGLEKTIEKPVSLLDTKKKLDKLFADMKKFMSKKSEVPVAPKPKEAAPVQEENIAPEADTD